MPKYPTVSMEQLQELRDQGKSYSEIAREVGLSSSAVAERFKPRLSRKKGGVAVVKRSDTSVKVDNTHAGPEGFADLFNDGRIESRRLDAVRGRIDRLVDSVLKRKAFLDGKGLTEEQLSPQLTAKAPRGFFTDVEGPKLAHVSGQDWRALRDEYTHMQIVKDGLGKGGEVIIWVDPDNIDSYRKKLEE